MSPSWQSRNVPFRRGAKTAHVNLRAPVALEGGRVDGVIVRYRKQSRPSSHATEEPTRSEALYEWPTIRTKGPPRLPEGPLDREAGIANATLFWPNIAGGTGRRFPKPAGHAIEWSGRLQLTVGGR